MPHSGITRDIISELRTAPRKATSLRDLVGSAETRSLVEQALQQAGSMSAFVDRIGSSSYSTIGKILREAGLDYAALCGRPDGEDDECDLAYWKSRAQRLERDQKRHADVYANIRAVMRDVMREYPVEKSLRAYYQPTRPGLAEEEITWIFISDTHVGELVLREHTAGLTTYSTETFVERCEMYRDHLDRLVNGHLRKVYPLKKAFVVYLGDASTGEDIFPMQPHRIDRGLMFQMVEGAVHLSRLLRWICGMFEQVFAFFIPGNHGRTKTTTLNADFILYLLMQQRLANQDNLKVVLSDSDMCGLYLDHTLGLLDWPDDLRDRRWNYLLTHGHQTRGWMGVPYYGLDRLVQRISQTTGILWDHTFVGHHHTSADTDDWTVVGSWVGGTDFSVGRMQKASQPKQLIRGFNPRYGLTWSYPIYLGEKPGLTTESEQTPGVYTPHNRLVTVLEDEGSDQAPQ